MSLLGTSRLVSYSADTRICISAGRETRLSKLPCSLRIYSIRKARMGSTDAARRAGKMAAAKVIVAIQARARTMVNGSLELKPYTMECSVLPLTNQT